MSAWPRGSWQSRRRTRSTASLERACSRRSRTVAPRISGAPLVTSRNGSPAAGEAPVSTSSTEPRNLRERPLHPQTGLSPRRWRASNLAEPTADTTPFAADGFAPGRHCRGVAVAALASRAHLAVRLRRVGALSDRRRTRWGLGGCLLLALLLRAPYASAPLGLDEGGIAYIAQRWTGGHGSLYGSYWLDRPPLLVGLFKIAVLGGDRGVRVLGALAAMALVVGVAQLGRALAG